jgi:hypothetical protein
MLTIINALFFRLMSLVISIMPDAFDCLWEICTNYFLENFVESPSIVSGSQLTPASNATTTEVEPELCPCCEEELHRVHGIVEAPLFPDSFEDPHHCCATYCSPILEPVGGLMPEATANQGTNNGRNTKETSKSTNL